MRVFRFVLSLMLTLGALAPLPTASAQVGTEGRATIGGEQVTLLPPLHVWDAEAQFITFAFFPEPPPAGVEDEARRFGDWLFDLPARRIILEMDFEPGQPMAMAEQLTSCRVLAVGFRAELDLTGRAADCHILSVGGFLRPGGGVIGVVHGKGNDYELFLPFSMTLGDNTAPGAGAAPTAAAEPPLPLDTVEGTAEFDGQTLTLTHGLAWWDERRREVRVGLFEREPPPGILGDMQSGSWGEGGPSVMLHFEVAGAGTPTVASVDSCYVNVSFPRGGSIGRNTNADGCGINEFSGEIAAGGQVAVGLSGSASGPQDKAYSWSLRLHLPLAR